MEGKGDPRRGKGTLRHEFKTAQYIDTLTDLSVDWYMKYRENYLMFSDGNHETTIRKFCEVDLSSRLSSGLFYKGKMDKRIDVMPYAGWVFFTFMKTT